jgi:hypothetical protein
MWIWSRGLIWFGFHQGVCLLVLRFVCFLLPRAAAAAAAAAGGGIAELR